MESLNLMELSARYDSFIADGIPVIHREMNQVVFAGDED